MSRTAKNEIEEDADWIEIKVGPIMEEPVYYWFEPLHRTDRKTVLEFLVDFFGIPQLRDFSEETKNGSM